MQRIDIDDPEVDMDLGQRLLYGGALFTGEAVEYQGESLVHLDTYTEGVQDGPTREWYPDGTLREEGTLRRGVVVGEYRTWHPNGVLARLQLWDEEGRGLRSETRWDENGVPETENGQSG